MSTRPAAICCRLINPHTGLFIRQLAVHDDLVRAVDRGQVTLMVMIDLIAAFDTVDHELMLSVLSERFGVTDTTLTWFTSDLSGRTHQVRHGGQNSATRAVNCGVPQGFVQGPRVFIAYTEDIVELVIEATRCSTTPVRR
jgi:Reverse transcriptase (RNA-dependent DNA polymerase)